MSGYGSLLKIFKYKQDLMIRQANHLKKKNLSKSTSYPKKKKRLIPGLVSRSTLGSKGFNCVVKSTYYSKGSLGRNIFHLFPQRSKPVDSNDGLQTYSLSFTSLLSNTSSTLALPALAPSLCMLNSESYYLMRLHLHRSYLHPLGLKACRHNLERQDFL